MFICINRLFSIINHQRAVSVLATMLFYPTSNVPFSSLILIEPAMVAPSSPENEMYKMVAAMTPQRRDIWDTREAARRYFEARIPWAAWDARVLDRYIVRLPFLCLHRGR